MEYVTMDIEVKELRQVRRNLNFFLRGFRTCIKTPESRAHFRTYIEGQVSDLERKSVEPMALHAGVAPRTLQEFLGLHRWDHEALRVRVQQRVRDRHADENAIAVIDETGHPKKGDKTAGVERQYCGATGKIDNCVVTVHVGYASGDFHALLDSDLYLPESWAADRERCRTAGIPDTVRYRPKWQIALDLLDRVILNGVALRYLAADEAYGRCAAFRQGVSGYGLIYMVEVPCSQQGWTKQPQVVTPPKHAPRLAVGEKEARRVDRLWKRGGPPWELYHIKDTQAGAVVWEARATRFFPSEDGLPAEEGWLIIARNVLTGEIKYFLSNASADTPVALLLHVAFSRWHIERVFEDAKGEIGMDHFEVRGHLPLTRHLILCMVSFLFLAEEAIRLKKNPWWTICQVREVVEAQLDPATPPREIQRRLERIAHIIEYWQRCAQKAARAHKKKRVRELHLLGIFLSKITKCYHFM
jgi:SRSO17 transposase